jgi:YggT family protein
MIVLVLLTFADLFIFVFNVLILTRVITSYIAKPGNRFYEGLVSITEPMLAPVRRLMPQAPGVDLAPLVTFFLLQGIQLLLHAIFGA